MRWSETLVADIRRDTTHEAQIPNGDWDLHADDGYEIPRYDIGPIPATMRKRVKVVDRATRGDYWPGHYLNGDTLDIADGFNPAAGNDMSLIVEDSTCGRWTVVWGYAAYLHEVQLFGRTIWRTGLAPSGARWVAARVELREPWTGSPQDPVTPSMDSGHPIDARVWNGNAWKSRGAGLGPAVGEVTADELAYAVAQDGILPRILPVYMPNTGGAVCPAATCENPNPAPGDFPGGGRGARLSTEEQRQQWASDRGLKGLERKQALVFARSLSVDGRGWIAGATVPPKQRPGVWTSHIDGIDRALLYGMPGLNIGLGPLVGYLRGKRYGTSWGRYDDIREEWGTYE